MGENFLNSLRVTPQHYLLTGVFGGVTHLSISWAIEKASEGKPLEVVPFAAIGIASGFMTSLAVLAIHDYTVKYNRMKGMFRDQGWDSKIVKAQLYTYCGRRVSRLAATDSGYRFEFNEYIQQRGKSTSQ